MFLNIPAGTGGETVSIQATPGGIVSVPASVVVPEGTLSTTISVQGSSVGTTSVSAGLNGSEASSAVEVLSIPGFTTLVIVEVYYDHTAGLDNGYEWVKISNGTGAPIDLSGYSIGWGGTDYTVGLMDLSGTVNHGECFLIGGPNGDSASGFPGAPAFDLSQDFSPDLQNSSSSGLADGVALFDLPSTSVTTGTFPIDAVIYGVSNDNDLLDENGSGAGVDVGDAPAESSVHRLSDSSWEINPTPSPLTCIPFPSP